MKLRTVYRVVRTRLPYATCGLWLCPPSTTTRRLSRFSGAMPDETESTDATCRSSTGRCAIVRQSLNNQQKTTERKKNVEKDAPAITRERSAVAMELLMRRKFVVAATVHTKRLFLGFGDKKNHVPVVQVFTMT